MTSVSRESTTSTVPLWRNRDYLLLWSGQTISSIGSGVSTLAFPLLALSLTHSPAIAGLMGATRAIPYLLISLPAGALADRWNRKLVMWICDAMRAVALSSVALGMLFRFLTVPQLFVVTFIEGTLFVLFDLAEVASLPQVVATEQLPAAFGQNQATLGVASLIAPAVGGVLFAVVPFAPFAVDALSYLVSVGTLLAIRTRFQQERQQQIFHLGRDIREGVVWLWGQPLLRYMALLTGGNNLIFAGIDLILIVLLQHRGATSTLIGLVFAISGIGGILGSFVGSFVQKRMSFPQVVIGTLWGTAIAFCGYIVFANFIAIGITSAIVFFLGVLYNVVVVSYRLRLIPDALQGRVNSIYRLITYGSLPIGAALTGWLVQQIGVYPTLLIVVIALVGLALTTFNSLVRNAPSSPVIAVN